MGFNFKKLLPIGLNPVAAIGTALEGGIDLWAAHEEKMGAKAADSLTREMNAQQMGLAREQMQMQKEFAQHGIKWRTDDAIASGIHPLAAMGASGASYSPVSAMMEAPTAEARSRGNMERVLGQNLSRATAATMSMEDRAAARLRLESLSLDNQIKTAELRKLNSQPAVPLPTPGQPSANWQETSYPSVAYMRSPTGMVPIMPPNLAEALESDETGQTQWIIRYRGGPNFSPKERPAKELLPPGTNGWSWSYPLQEWQAKSRHQTQISGRQSAEQKWGKPFHKYNFQDAWRDLTKTRR